MSIPVYASTGTFVTRKNGRNYRLIGEMAPLLCADGFEFLMYDSWNDEIKDIRSYLKDSGCSFPVMHLDKAIGDELSQKGRRGLAEAERKLARDMETALAIGAKKLVLHLWNGPYSDRRFEEILPVSARFYELAESAGLELTIENVISCSHLTIDRLKQMTAFDSRLTFTYDTKMAFFRDENRLLPDEMPLFRNISHLHVNDAKYLYNADGRLTVLHIGEGEIDFEAFFKAVKQAGFSGTATVESTSCREDGSVEVERLNKSLQKVKQGLNS